MPLTYILFLISILLIFVAICSCVANEHITKRASECFISACIFMIIGGIFTSISDYTELKDRADSNLKAYIQVKAELASLKSESSLEPLTPESVIILSTESIEALTEVSGECNIAKHAIINKIQHLTDDMALNIIKECKIFKLQQELQE